MVTHKSDIATKLVGARKASGLTQAAVAQQSGIPLSSYQAYEQGKATPPYERVESIMSVLGKHALSAVPIEKHTEQADAPDIFFLILSMNGQPFYRFRCIGEVLGDVEVDIALGSKVERDPSDRISN